MRRDFVKFVVFAAMFLLVLNFLSRSIPEPKPRDKKDEPAEVPLIKATPESAGGGWVMHYARQIKMEEDRARLSLQTHPKEWYQLGAFAGSAWAASGNPMPRKTVGMGSKEGDSPYHLFVELDPNGACVRRVVLNKFETTSRLGEPIREPLELIQQNEVPENYCIGSNLLYHFDIDSPESKRPLDTLGKRQWDVIDSKVGNADGEQSVSFATTVDGVRITKTFTLSPRTYHIGLEVKLRRVSAPKNSKFRYQLTGSIGLPIEGAWYTTTFRHSLIGMREGKDLWRDFQDVASIALKQGGEAVKRDSSRAIQYAGVAVQFFASVIAVDDEQDNRNFLESARPTLEAQVIRIEAQDPINPLDPVINIVDKRDNTKPKERILLNSQVHNDLLLRNPKRGDRYDLLAVPVNEPNDLVNSDHMLAVKLLTPGQAQPMWKDDITVRVNTEAVELPDSDGEVVHKYLIYNGPVKPRLLGQMRGVAAVEDGLVDRYIDKLNLNTLTDYHSPGFMGRFASTIFLTNLIIFFTNLCHGVLGLLHSIIPSWGICIILLTVIVRGMMFPLSRKQAMTTMKMQELNPELKKLKEKFKDDRQGFAMAQMELFRKHGVNPLGTCWMLLLQLPIFMGLYYCLQESVFFRLAGFLWIDNLAAPDMLIKWGEGIPLLSRPEDYGSLLYLGPFLNVLPIIAVTLMLYQQKKMMPPPTDDQQAMQMKMMKYMMIFFGLMFYKVAAGLCLYFIISSVWGFTERKLLPKKKVVGGVESADSLLQKMTGETSSSVEEKPSSNGSSTNVANNRGKRRQDRKRRDRGGSQAIQTSAPRPDAGGADAKDEATEGWFSNLRRRFGEWWQDLLKKASKK